MSKTYYFVVAASLDESGKPLFVLDDEVFLARFPEGGVYDEESGEWMKPWHGDADETIDQELFLALAGRIE